MTEEKKTTSRQRYDQRRREAANEKPALVAQVEELNAQIATLIKVVQDRDGEIVQLKADVKDLYQHNRELEARVTALEKRQTG